MDKNARPYKIAPSILPANFSELGKDVLSAEKSGADYIHIDVMDGVFVPNITMGPMVVSSIRQITTVPLDVHLMTVNPERHIKDFIDAGASILTFHVESCLHLHRNIEKTKSLGKKAGVTLNPSTSLSTIEEILPYVDLVLIMSVNPGFSGQTFIKTSLNKIKRTKEMLIKAGNPKAEIEVDGGINSQNIKDIYEAGANVFVAGNAIFNKSFSVHEGITKLKKAIEG